VVTLSDRASRGEYEDRSGPSLVTALEHCFQENQRLFSITRDVIPDDESTLRKVLDASVKDHDFIFTTGGTGIGSRDITPDVVSTYIDKTIPGIMEMIRVKYGMQKPNALLSRGVAGIAGDCFLFTLPGSVKGVEEYMTEISKSMMHLIYMRHGIDSHK
jgi:molybdenum cofactor synthesis domain-containing protein